MHSIFLTGFQCLRLRRLRTGKTEKGEHSPTPSLQCGASLRAKTLEPRTLYAIEIHNWIPVSALQKATHWYDRQGENSKSVSPVRSESSSADTGAQDLVNMRDTLLLQQVYSPFGRPPKTSRTLFFRASGLKGFCKKAKPVSKRPCRGIALSV
jgi:hypothetical protein